MAARDVAGVGCVGEQDLLLAIDQRARNDLRVVPAKRGRLHGEQHPLGAGKDVRKRARILVLAFLVAAASTAVGQSCVDYATFLRTISHRATAADARALVVQSGIAYVADADSGLTTLDVSIPEAPVRLGRVDTPGSALDVAVSGSLAYVADGTFGRIRASADAQRTGVGMVGTGLNVDARPTVLEGDRVLLELTVEYSPLREGSQVTQRPTVLNESLTVILQSGKPMMVSQAADPVTDRKMSVEVRASILK